MSFVRDESTGPLAYFARVLGVFAVCIVLLGLVGGSIAFFLKWIYRLPVDPETACRAQFSEQAFIDACVKGVWDRAIRDELARREALIDKAYEATK